MGYASVEAGEEKDMEKILAVIPARGGSKGILHKNIYPLCGKPLIEYTIDAAFRSGMLDDVLVSTDDKQIADVSKKAGAWVPFIRPSEYSGDHAKTIDVVMHAVDFLNTMKKHYDILVLLQPTSPLRDAKDIRNAIDLFRSDDDITSLASVSEADNPVLIRYMNENDQLEKLLDNDSTIRRQDMKKSWRINGAIYINYFRDLCEKTSFNDNKYGFVIDSRHGIDIDTVEDIRLAEFYLSEKALEERK
jgi:CMP-N-acetylneuraminic acid synthetase